MDPTRNEDDNGEAPSDAFGAVPDAVWKRPARLTLGVGGDAVLLDRLDRDDLDRALEVVLDR